MSSAVTSVAVADSILSVVIKAVVGTWIVSKSLPVCEGMVRLGYDEVRVW